MEINRDFILRITRECGFTGERLEKTKVSLSRIMKQIECLDDRDSLTIPYLNKQMEIGFNKIRDRQYEIKKLDHLFPLYEEYMKPIDKLCWSDYFLSIKKFNLVVVEFNDVSDKYKNFMPKNAEYLKEAVRKILYGKGYLIDGYFEGDYHNWIGVYARPKDKPTYLDATTAEEAKLQEKNSVNGFKQDFSEWFEWEILDGKITE